VQESRDYVYFICLCLGKILVPAVFEAEKSTLREEKHTALPMSQALP
jgi:hypothetical protein